MQGVEKIHIADCTARLYYSVKVGHNTLKMDGKSPLTASAEVCEEAWFIKQKTSRDNLHTICYLHPMELMGIRGLISLDRLHWFQLG